MLTSKTIVNTEAFVKCSSKLWSKYTASIIAINTKTINNTMKKAIFRAFVAYSFDLNNFVISKSRDISVINGKIKSNINPSSNALEILDPVPPTLVHNQ